MNKYSKLALGAICTASLAACFDSGTESNNANAKPTISQSQIDTFKDSCNKAGGEFSKTAGCNGTAKCKGSFINLDSAKITYNECAGKNSCNGYQCIEPKAMMSSMPMSSMTKISSSSMSSMAMSSMASMSSSSTSATAKSLILASPSLSAFQQNCTSNGGKISEEVCKGHSTCAGLYFTTADNKATENSCQGHNSCAGSKCEI